MSDDVRTPTGAGPTEDLGELREQALKRLKDKRGLMAHVLSYVMVNLLLVAVWYATGHHFFWPLFPLFGWGIGLVFHAWDVLRPEPRPDQVEAEMERLRRHNRHA
ncbi:2TM domain-containing protein [Phycicoccus sp. Soil748]|uniref:2TM domain-containing protein n=1 Tax=Phycicoccus sp. Soil748 TaxID=1736397 RepID=UPI000ADB61F6|nr:2TM domain-containing protein [Phycicoccus sp. Soil748]